MAAAALLGVTVAAAAVMVPWRPLPAGTPPLQVKPARDFTAAQLALEQAFHAAIRPWSYSALAVSVLVPLALGLTPMGVRLLGRLRSRWPGRWVLQVLVGVIALTLASRLASLPLSAMAEVELRRFGLSTQTWASWTVDVAKGWVLGAAVTSLALLTLVAVARRWPRWWWPPAAAAAALGAVAGSFVYPLVAEPLFNRFVAMSPSPLRTELLQLAERDDVPVQEILVADASRRTTAANAYVSGLGVTRRVVVYDTLVDQATPDEVALVVAHELGHAAERDVLISTALGALAGAGGVCLLAALLRWRPLLRQAGVDGPADPRSVALVLALSVLGAQLAAPAVNLVSRRIEVRADLHALELTRDPATFASMQRHLALTNLADLDPATWRVIRFSSHPSAPSRIALARAWAQQQGIEPPGDLAAELSGTELSGAGLGGPP